MRLQRDVVLEELLMVGDDQDPHLRATNPRNAFARQPHRIGVETTVGLVEHGKPRGQHGQLKDFCSLHFTAGKAIVDIAASKILVHLQFRHLRLQLTAKVFHRNQFLALFPLRIADITDRVTEEVGDPHARDRHRTLKRQEESHAGPLVWLHRQHILSAAVGFHDLDRASGHLVGRVAHDRVTEGALTGAVGAHQGMHLTTPDLQIDSLEDLSFLNSDMQILDNEFFGVLAGHETLEAGKTGGKRQRLAAACGLWKGQGAQEVSFWWSNTRSPSPTGEAT